MYKLIVAGSQTITDYKLVDQLITEFLDGKKDVEVVSAGVAGVGMLGERYAKGRRWPVKRVMADIQAHGPNASYRRNSDMIKYADGCLIVWDGQSRNEKNLFNQVNRSDLDLKLYIKRR